MEYAAGLVVFAGGGSSIQVWWFPAPGHCGPRATAKSHTSLAPELGLGVGVLHDELDSILFTSAMAWHVSTRCGVELRC